MPTVNNLRAALALILGATAFVSAATFTVSKDGRGAYSTINAALQVAGPGDIIEILDAAVYAEQVTIDSTKNGLTLRSSNPLALRKPTIRFQDNQNQGPRTCQEALVPANITFDQNGALRLLRVRNVTIDGIGVDGVAPSPFGHAGVWGNGVDCNGQKHPLFHGNGGIAIYVSGNITVRNSDISNAYFGISVKDRNEGGIFANVNPADLEKSNVVPLSGFGKTGNHVFEKNRIHHNSWAFFFESSWDLGSIARYNLIYENHHPSPQAAAAVKALPDGSHQPGGAFLFKDVMLSPMAIYNNTFWHNFVLFAGGYRPGAQHLIFNNIYAKPKEYLSQSASFSNPFHILDPYFVNRMHHSIYAAQIEAPQMQTQSVRAQEYDQTLQQQVVKDSLVPIYRSVRIMNNMGNVAQGNMTVDITLPMSSGPLVKPTTVNSVNLPGGLIGSGTQAFPASANVRWYEIQFKSTDPESPDFLTPDWDNEVVKQYVKNGGWPAAGIYNSDGKVADIGAIPSVARHTDDYRVSPLSPVIINGTVATLTFDLSGLQGQMTAPKIKYIRLVRGIPVDLDGFGGKPTMVVPTPEVVNPSATTLQLGGNTLTVSGFAPITENYAFFEIIVEGTGSNGQPVTTNVGFLPYRKLDYRFLVEVYDVNGTTKLDEVTAGQPVRLRITPQNNDGSLFNNPINPVEVNLNSGHQLLVPTQPPVPLNLTEVLGIVNQAVTFTKVPSGGVEYVTVSGLWRNNNQSQAFFGASEGIRVLPGPPEKVVFQTPPSKVVNPAVLPTVIDPGTLFDVELQVLDAYGNVTNQPGEVSLVSDKPNVGDVEGPASATSDNLGAVRFQAKVTNGNLDEIFTLAATLKDKNTDTGELKVGQARDKLWFLYSDVAAYNPAVELRGIAGERSPITVRLSHNGTAVIAKSVVFQISSKSGQLRFYGSADAANPATEFTLGANGEVQIWVTSTVDVTDDTLFAQPTTDNTVLGGSRGKVFFERKLLSVKSATYYADNGLGAVDRVEIYFQEALRSTPDKFEFAWPAADSEKRIAEGAAIKVNPADPTHYTITLSDPFTAGITSGSATAQLGRVFTATSGELPGDTLGFTIADAVGPLITSAQVLEKFEPGDDTLFVKFSEPINLAALAGNSLTLIKNGTQLQLNVLDAQGTPDSARIAVTDLGANAPTLGDSLKFTANGPAADAIGNKAHPDNRPVALELKHKPRPAVLNLTWDHTHLKTEGQQQRPGFMVLTPNPGNTWESVLGSVNGLARPCNEVGCGATLEADPQGRLNWPALTIETDRAVKFQLFIFDNLGNYVNDFSGEITDAQLGLDENGRPTGSSMGGLFRKTDPTGNYSIKIAWNPIARSGQKAGTGAYVARIILTSRTQNEAGQATNTETKKAIRFGLYRP